VRIMSADSVTSDGETQRDSALSEADKSTMNHKARITIDDIQMHDVPGGFQLKPGMPVTADIKVGERTLLTSIFASVLPVGMEGLRER
jgi:hemolysin D